MNIFRFTNYRDILQFKFDERVARNPRYSLRAFGRDLKMGSSGISEVMNAKLGISRARAVTIAKSLDFGKAETGYFVNLVLSEHARGQKDRKLASYEAKAQRDIYKNVTWIGLQKFELVAQWHHLAILESVYLNDFCPTPDWLANKLSIDKRKVVDALERMTQLKIMEFDGHNFKMLKSNLNIFTDDVYTPKGLAHYHKDFLGTALKKIESVDATEREFNACVVAIRKTQVPELKLQLRKLFDDFATQFEGQTNRDVLYHLGLQFFPH